MVEKVKGTRVKVKVKDLLVTTLGITVNKIGNGVTIVGRLITTTGIVQSLVGYLRAGSKRLYRLREKKLHLVHGLIQEKVVRVSMVEVRVSMVGRDTTQDMNIRMATIKMGLGLKGVIEMMVTGINHINKMTILKGMVMAIQIWKGRFNMLRLF
jgi:hypothetical protein